MRFGVGPVRGAEKEGFEPPVPVKVHLISSQARSTTLALFRREFTDFFASKHRRRKGPDVTCFRFAAYVDAWHTLGILTRAPS